MSDGSKLLVMGLKGSGKTTYMAALWHLIEAGEMPTALTVSQLQPDREYLNRIRHNWLGFQEVGRTSLRSQEMVSLLLRDAQTQTDINIHLPDLSGEVFRLQWATRKATKAFTDLLTNLSGVLLFIHPTDIVKSHRIQFESLDQSSTKGSKNNDEVQISDVAEPSAEAELVEWNAGKSPTQVQLVELLQYVMSLKESKVNLRIAMLISAWDLVKESILPSSWLENNVPLLSQFLTSNSDEITFRAYGVSALGGDLEKDIERLQDETKPSRRIKIMDDKLESGGDLTLPIRYLLDLEAAI